MTNSELLENIQKSINQLESNLTLKNDYTEELQQLDNYNSDIAVLRFYDVNNTNGWKINDLQKDIKRISEWMKEEMLRS